MGESPRRPSATLAREKNADRDEIRQRDLAFVALETAQRIRRRQIDRLGCDGQCAGDVALPSREALPSFLEEGLDRVGQAPVVREDANLEPTAGADDDGIVREERAQDLDEEERISARGLAQS